MFVEALLYDVSHPEAGGTCSLTVLTKSIANTTNTTSFAYNMTQLPNGTNITGVRTNIFHNETVVGDLVHTTNFPALAASLTFAEKILLAAVSAVLTVPLVVLCFTSLITLAMSKKNERLWEKFGTQDLGGNLVTRRKIVKVHKDEKDVYHNIIGLTSCGSAAFVHARQQDANGHIHHRSFTLTSKTEVAVGHISVTSASEGVVNANGVSTFGQHATPRSAKSLKLVRTKSGFLDHGDDTPVVSFEGGSSQEAGRHINVDPTDWKTNATNVRVINLFDPVQGRFVLPIGEGRSKSTENEAHTWTKLLNKVVNSLPVHKLALFAARSAAAGRLRHVHRFVVANERVRLDGATGNENLRDNEDRKTAHALRTLCEGLAEHANAAEGIMQKLLKRDQIHAAEVAAAEGKAADACCWWRWCYCCCCSSISDTANARISEMSRADRTISREWTKGEIEEQERKFLFRLKEKKMFVKKLRQEMLPRSQLLQEAEEDEAGKHLKGQKLCCCIPMHSVFQCAVVGDRHDINDRLRRRKKWFIYTMMSLYAVACAFYVVLFGFCHGQEVTLAWMESLFLQLILSAVLVRPMSIFVQSAILPTISIETGLKVRREEKARRSVATMKMEIETGRMEENPMNRNQGGGSGSSQESSGSDWTDSDFDEEEEKVHHALHLTQSSTRLEHEMIRLPAASITL